MSDTLLSENQAKSEELERAHFDGAIHVVSSYEALDEVYEKIIAHSVLGFDTETRPTFTKGHADRFVSIVQFATADQAWIIRTNILRLPEKLRAIFEHPAIVKVGLAVHEDIHRLRHFHPLAPQNLVDLQKLAKAAGYKELSLKKLSERILHLAVSKSARLSNWEADELTQKQLIYAATDAWLCYQLYYQSGLIENPIVSR